MGMTDQTAPDPHGAGAQKRPACAERRVTSQCMLDHAAFGAAFAIVASMIFDRLSGVKGFTA